MNRTLWIGDAWSRREAVGDELNHEITASVSFLLLVFCAPPALNADVTIRYKTDFKVGALVPPAIMQQASNGQKPVLPSVVVVQVKGDKGYSNAALSASLIDFTKQEITIIDPAHKLFSTVDAKDYWGEIGAAMPAIRPFRRRRKRSWNRSRRVTPAGDRAHGNRGERDGGRERVHPFHQPAHTSGPADTARTVSGGAARDHDQDRDATVARYGGRSAARSGAERVDEL